jgi:hypothetical protein
VIALSIAVILSMTLADRILSFNQSLQIRTKLPEGVEVLNPFQNPDTFELCKKFYKKFYDDHSSRTMLLGINPGRHGAGLTGIPFTDPIKLEEVCGIKNTMPKKAELSADFIYAMIHAFGGAEKFYSRFYFSSVSPLGFTRNGKNLNYYDLHELQESLHEFFMKTITSQLDFGMNRKVCYCLGEGKNYAFLSKINKEKSFFENIIPLPHPRFVMQYKRKKLPEYIQLYLSALV